MIFQGSFQTLTFGDSVIASTSEGDFFSSPSEEMFNQRHLSELQKASKHDTCAHYHCHCTLLLGKEECPCLHVPHRWSLIWEK